MPDYEKMYHILFNAITNALRELEAVKGEEAARLSCRSSRPRCPMPRRNKTAAHNEAAVFITPEACRRLSTRERWSISTARPC